MPTSSEPRLSPGHVVVRTGMLRVVAICAGLSRWVLLARPQILCCALQDSPHFRNEARKQAATEQKVARMKQQAAQLSPAELSTREKCVSRGWHLWLVFVNFLVPAEAALYPGLS